jgi:choline-sulfatase
MTRRSLLAAPALLSAQSRPSRPNILFLMADQHRADCVGAAGNQVIRTPNLDRLAREGVLFDNAYSSTPTCTPARTALLTGLSPWNHGMLGMTNMALRYPIEMPRAMGEAGYHTTGIGKMHYYPHRNTHGFHTLLLDESGRAQSPDYRSDYRSWFWSEAPNLDPDATGIGWNDHRAKTYVLPERLHPTTWTASTAVKFLESYQRPEPFFAKISFARPHSPYDPPERFMRQYESAELPAARVGKWASRYAPRSSDANDLWHGDLGPKQVRHSRQGYYGSVSFVDEQIGRVLEALERRGWLENTLILYTADHGDMTGDHHLWRKSYAYEASARIPMIVRWPKGMISADRGRRLAQPVEIRDILPTFLNVADASRDGLDGRSLMPLVNGKTDGWREVIDLEHNVCYSTDNHWNALTDGRMKYIFHAKSGEEQLFDLSTDRAELNDLAGDVSRSADLRKWRGRMIEHLAVRGEQWVSGGKLALRPNSMMTGANFPREKKPA